MKKWDKLDNAAKIFPSTVESSETRVFRVYCELNEEVCPNTLQQAVELAVKQLPQFQKILRKGLFWYYTEKSNLLPQVREEYRSPCSKLYHPGHHELLFEVTYYKKRINLEIFHVLSDGAGAAELLKSILAQYLNILHPGILPTDDPLLVNQLDIEDMDTDAFETYYTGEKNPRKEKTLWVHLIRPKRRENLDLHVTEGIVSTGALLELAHKYHATMTEFLVSVFIKSIIAHMKNSDLKKTIVVDIPINLRSFFPSDTTRNFFAVLPITYKPVSREDSLEDICAVVSEKFETIITKENLTGKINSLGSFERNMPMRLVPLFLKDPGLRFINFLSKRFVTGCFSNMGRFVLPESMAQYVHQIGVYSSTISIQAECASYQDRMVISFTDGFVDATTENEFFEQLKALGVESEIHTNTPAKLVSENPKKWIADPSKQTPENNDDVFPIPQEPPNKTSRYLHLANIGCVIAMILYALIYVFTRKQGYWIAIMCINTFYIWNGVARGILIHSSIMRRLFIRYLWTSIFYLALDIFSGWQQWSVATQIPVFALINIFLSIYVSIVMKTDTSSEELALYVTLECMMGIVPFVLCLTPVLHFNIMTFCLGLVCILILALCLFFRWKNVKHEYYKTFHI